MWSWWTGDDGPECKSRGDTVSWCLAWRFAPSTGRFCSLGPIIFVYSPGWRLVIGLRALASGNLLLLCDSTNGRFRRRRKQCGCNRR